PSGIRTGRYVACDQTALIGVGGRYASDLVVRNRDVEMPLRYGRRTAGDRLLQRHGCKVRLAERIVNLERRIELCAIGGAGIEVHGQFEQRSGRGVIESGGNLD